MILLCGFVRFLSKTIRRRLLVHVGTTVVCGVADACDWFPVTKCQRICAIFNLWHFQPNRLVCFVSSCGTDWISLSKRESYAIVSILFEPVMHVCVRFA